VAAAAAIWALRYSLGGLLGAVQALMVRQSVSIQGHWDAAYERDGQKMDERAHLKQLLHVVWGEISNQGNHRRYRIRGTFRNRILAATYDLVGDKSAIDTGTFTVRLKDDGNSMVGTYSWLEGAHDLPQAGAYSWSRRGV
jgi:hypothetical protein